MFLLSIFLKSITNYYNKNIYIFVLNEFNSIQIMINV